MKSKQKFFLYTAGILYILFMLWLLFGQRLDRWSDGYDPARMLEKINLIPFRTINEFLHHAGGRNFALFNLVGNVVCFIPMGIFIPAVFPKAGSFRHTVLWSAAAVLCVEIVQLVSLLGALDVDDLLLNLVGAGIGYGIYRIIFRKQ